MHHKKEFELRIKTLNGCHKTPIGTVEAATSVHADLEMALIISESILGKDKTTPEFILSVHQMLSAKQSQFLNSSTE